MTMHFDALGRVWIWGQAGEAACLHFPVPWLLVSRPLSVTWSWHVFDEVGEENSKANF